mmetsp:Transcript_16944/g.46889  ORF Transcript_16944/g.46889 Transcript_16944/m.46889 type:complete len:340 (+) Transcript_16944:189-1208(+)
MNHSSLPTPGRKPSRKSCHITRSTSQAPSSRTRSHPVTTSNLLSAVSRNWHSIQHVPSSKSSSDGKSSWNSSASPTRIEYWLLGRSSAAPKADATTAISESSRAPIDRAMADLQSCVDACSSNRNPASGVGSYGEYNPMTTSCTSSVGERWALGGRLYSSSRMPTRSCCMRCIRRALSLWYGLKPSSSSLPQPPLLLFALSLLLPPLATCVFERRADGCPMMVGGAWPVPMPLPRAPKNVLRHGMHWKASVAVVLDDNAISCARAQVMKGMMRRLRLVCVGVDRSASRVMLRLMLKCASSSLLLLLSRCLDSTTMAVALLAFVDSLLLPSALKLRCLLK